MTTPEIPDGVPEEVYLKVLRAFFGADPDGDHPSNVLLQGLLEAPVFFRHAVAVAFAAGRESAYDRDEWRVVAVHPRTKEELVNGPVNESLGRALLKVAHTFDPDARLEHRRAGSAPSWVRVPEAGGTGELQA